MRITVEPESPYALTAGGDDEVAAAGRHQTRVGTEARANSEGLILTSLNASRSPGIGGVA